MQQDTHAYHPAATADAIRFVFLSPQRFYTPTEAAALLGWSCEEVEAAINDGEIDAARTCSGSRLAREEVAVALTSDVPIRVIEFALGSAASEVMPAMTRFAELRVELPRYQTEMLRRLAERERMALDDYLARHLLDLAAAEDDWLRTNIPHFDEAVRWPAS
jgi:excisionase family DNA binding protein